jgi:glycosyltransferase involved in cell wall biosynthesis
MSNDGDATGLPASRWDLTKALLQLVLNMSRDCPDAPVRILLAAYNGAEWLAEQLESIQRQTFTHWRLLVRDDGSSDGTPDIVRAFAARDGRIELLADGGGRLGLLGNFAVLMEAALQTSAGYFAFCDQDDVWHPEKLAWQMKCLAAAEQVSPSHTPIAVHSDLAVVDAQLRPIHASFLRYQGLWHEAGRPLRTLVVQNFVTGCTLLINRPLLELAVPLPGEALVHDWWLALCAAAAGRLEFVPRATVSYRQHGRNTIGAKRWWTQLVPKLRHFATRGKSLLDTLKQADALRMRLEQSGEATQNQRFLGDYCRVRDVGSNALTRIRRLRRLGVHRQGRLRNIVMLAQWCLAPAAIPGAGARIARPHCLDASASAAASRSYDGQG